MTPLALCTPYTCGAGKDCLPHPAAAAVGTTELAAAAAAVETSDYAAGVQTTELAAAAAAAAAAVDTGELDAVSGSGQAPVSGIH